MIQPFLEVVLFLHGLFATFSVVIAVVIAAIISRGSLSDRSLRGLKVFAILFVALSLAVNLTGASGYIFYRLPSADSPRSLILKTAPFAHEIFFETMEYVALIGPIWSTVIAWTIFHHGERTTVDPELRRMILLFTILFVAWMIAVAYTGLIPTMIAPVG